jgi:CelD/BcsL family acetyltransferase involved in cellulose biosynthesis
MKLQTIESFDQFQELRSEWNTLLRSSASNCVFLTHEWLSTWWKHLSEGRRLSIVTLRDGGELIGILPVAERRAQLTRMMPRVFEFLGSGVIGSDYLDVVSAPSREVEVIGHFVDYLTGRGRMLQFGQLRAGRSMASRLADGLQQSNWTGDRRKINVCPHIDLTGHSWESYLATVGPNVRKNINRCLRNLPKTFRMRVDYAPQTINAGEGLSILMELHRKRWEASGKSEAFHSESVVAFHREFVEMAAQQGWLRLITIHLDGVPAASLYGLLYDGVFYFYQSGFDPAFSKYSVGVATMALSINLAIEEGAREFDFLHGDEEYKFHWTRQTRDLMRIELHPPRVTAWVYKQALEFNRAARQMARRVLTSARNHAALNH